MQGGRPACMSNEDMSESAAQSMAHKCHQSSASHKLALRTHAAGLLHVHTATDAVHPGQTCSCPHPVSKAGLSDTSMLQMRALPQEGCL